jgi:membrane protease YdiL (CAAX protease family)
MSQADGSIVKSSENVAAVAGGWRDGILVLAIVLAPLGLAIVLFASGVFALAGWQMVRGVAVELPSRANLQPYGLLAYAVASWIAVAAAWLWSSRRGMSRDVFLFRRLTWPALIASVFGFVVAMYGVPVLTHGLSQLTGGRGPDVRIDFHDPQSVAIYLLLFVVTTPLCEEILYRGLLVAWLRRLGWRDPAILLMGSLIFGANHIIPLGLVWGAAMAVVLGAILFALRLRYESLTPAWLAHFLFNAQPFLIYPLLMPLAPGLLPGHLS